VPKVPDPRTIPTEVRAPVGADVVEIDWQDEHTSRIPNDRLRGYCPCAGCQGHEGPLTFVESGSRTIDDVSQVGNYALSFRWGDGHESGIYTFPYLRRLCACPECLPRFETTTRP
jgi:DUF971 family protein